MIQTTIPVDHGDIRVGTQKNIIQIEILEAAILTDTVKFTVENNAVLEGGARLHLCTVEKEISQDMYNALFAGVSQMIEQYDTSQMTRFQLEKLRHRLGLYIFVTTDFIKIDGVQTDKTVWGVLPENWELV